MTRLETTITGGSVSINLASTRCIQLYNKAQSQPSPFSCLRGKLRKGKPHWDPPKKDGHRKMPSSKVYGVRNRKKNKGKQVDSLRKTASHTSKEWEEAPYRKFNDCRLRDHCFISGNCSDESCKKKCIYCGNGFQHKWLLLQCTSWVSYPHPYGIPLPELICG